MTRGERSTRADYPQGTYQQGGQGVHPDDAPPTRAAVYAGELAYGEARAFDSQSAEERSRHWDEDARSPWDTRPYPGETRAVERAVEPPRRYRAPRGYTRSDARIREDVCECLAHAAELDPSELEVTVKEGEVTLAGSVSTREMKRTAEQLAIGIPGVRDVHNGLRVHTRGNSHA